MGIGVVGLEPDRLAVFGDGLVVASPGRPGRCRGCRGPGAPGADRHGGRQVPHRLLGLGILDVALAADSSLPATSASSKWTQKSAGWRNTARRSTRAARSRSPAELELTGQQAPGSPRAGRRGPCRRRPAAGTRRPRRRSLVRRACARRASRHGSGSAARAAATSRRQSASGRSGPLAGRRPSRRGNRPAPPARTAPPATCPPRPVRSRRGRARPCGTRRRTRRRSASGRRARRGCRGPIRARPAGRGRPRAGGLFSAASACSRSSWASRAATRLRSGASASPWASRPSARLAAESASAHFGPSRRRGGLGLAAEPGRVGQGFVDGAGRLRHPLGPLLLDPDVAPAAGQAEQDHRRRRDRRQPAPAALLDALQLGPPQLLLHAGQVGRAPAPRPRRRRAGGPPARGARQSFASATSSASAPQPSSRAERVGQVAPRRLALDLARRPARERRLARQDLAEDRAQGEDVGPLVDPVDLAPGLLGGHVRRRAHHRAGPRQVGVVGAAPGRGDHRLLAVGLAGVASSTTPPRGRTLARPQSITWTSPKRPPSRSTASGRGGSPPGRGRRPPSGRPAPKIARNRGQSSIAGRARSVEQLGQRVALDQLHGEVTAGRRANCPSS